jgi:hypothetical protein
VIGTNRAKGVAFNFLLPEAAVVMLFYESSLNWARRDSLFDGPRMRRESTPICERGPQVAGASGTPAANSPNSPNSPCSR